MTTCEICSKEFDSKKMLKTHLLLKHPEHIQDRSEYDIKLSEGGLETREHEKGEQFGYRK